MAKERAKKLEGDIFDIDRIAENLKGWDFKEQKGHPGQYSFSRTTVDNLEVTLTLNPTAKTVSLSETERENAMFSINFPEEVETVYTNDEEVTFWMGEYEYVISYNGGKHVYKHLADNPGDKPFITRNYIFPSEN